MTAPAATLILIATLVASLVGLYSAPQLIERNLFRPYWFLRQRQYATLLTSAFIHASPGHLLFNCVTLWSFGFPLEGRIGGDRFVALYALGLLVSGLGTLYKQRNNPDYACLGASGAILAVLFASIVYFPTQSIMIMPIPLPIPAPLFALGYLSLHGLCLTPDARAHQPRRAPRQRARRPRLRRAHGSVSTFEQALQVVFR